MTQIMSGMNNLLYEARHDQQAVDGSVDLIRQWVDHFGGDRAVRAYDAVDFTLNLADLADSLEGIGGVGVKQGSGGLRFYDISTGRYISNIEGWGKVYDVVSSLVTLRDPRLPSGKGGNVGAAAVITREELEIRRQMWSSWKKYK